MKRIMLVTLLLLSAPAWAGDAYTECLKNNIGVSDREKLCEEIVGERRETVERLWPGGAQVILTPQTMGYRQTPKQYEYDIIPEPELESYLNQGWECVKVYSIDEPYTGWDKTPGVTKWVQNGKMPVNRAIIRRTNPAE